MVDADLVSIMAVNNEVGTIQPIEDIGALCVGEGVDPADESGDVLR